MDLSSKVLGSDIAKELHDRIRAGILQIGADTFTRRQLARVDCFSWMAVVNLNYLLNKHLKVRDTRDVYDRVSPQELALPRFGAMTLAVLGACFEAKGIGGEAPLENYIKKHLHEAKLITFTTLKKREERGEAEERAARRTRKRDRRDRAHRLRLARFGEHKAAS